MSVDRNHNGKRWRIRRRIIVGTLLYCAAMVGYIGIYGEGSSAQEAIATSLILLAGSVIGSYVFGAVWDDKSNKDKED